MYTKRRTRHDHAPAFTALEKKLLLALGGIIALTVYCLVARH
jgi:hypothetical protein